jgi:GNAT superfamily N-acetyltransferase
MHHERVGSCLPTWSSRRILPSNWTAPWRKVFQDFPRTFELFDLLELHHPKEPHYHLQFLGVRPESQGTGIGTALLRAMLDHCDLEGVAAYLEADERSKLLYLKHGFEATAELRLREGPSFWPMWRARRRSS